MKLALKALASNAFSDYRPETGYAGVRPGG
jgi:hypothetical protein